MPRRYRKRAPRRPRRKAPMYRSVQKYNPQPVFTETWDAGQLTVGSSGTLAGLFNMSFSSLPQSNQYASLYRQFRILRNQWILLPRFSNVDPNFGTSPSFSLARIAYAVNDTSAQTNPTSEIAVLQSNGAKIVNAMSGRPIRIFSKPVPELYVGAPSVIPTPVAMNKKAVWLNTPNVNNTAPATNVLHQGITWFITAPANTSSGSIVVFDVYCKTTVQFKDPA